MLHQKQIELIELLRIQQDNPLTIRELQEELGLSSPSLVHHHIKQLEKKGFLKRNPSNPKDYQLVMESGTPITYINLYGMARCGPEGTVLSGDPEDRVPFYSKMLHFPIEEAFMVKALGDSMEPRIHDGDIVIAQKKAMADNGQIVVCVLDGKVMIKRFSRQDDIILQSLNAKYFPIIVTKSNEFLIEGIFKGLICPHPTVN